MRFSLFLLVTCMVSLPQLSFGAPKKTIDLGELEITGEVRKPLLDRLDSDRYTDSLLPRMAKEQMSAYENNLLNTQGSFTPAYRSAVKSADQGRNQLKSYEDRLVDGGR